MKPNQDISKTSTNSAAPPLTLIAKPAIFNGYMNGYRQPVALLKVRFNPTLSPNSFHHLAQALQYYFPKHGFNKKFQSSMECIHSFIESISFLQKESGLPIFEEGEIKQNLSQKNEFVIWVPLLFEVCFHPVL